MTKLSVVLATYNEEKHLSDCLKSVKPIANEIIVVDGSSTDNTRQIAKNMGAKVYKTTNKPIFHINKQMAINKASGDWILQLDADERLTPELRDEIKKTIKNPGKKVAFYLKRKNLFLGGFLKKGGQYPDPVIRLFKKDKAYLPCQSVHEQMKVKGPVGTLKSDMIHLTNPTLKDYFVRFRRYTDLDAQKIKSGEIKANFLTHLVFKPIHWFLLTFVRHKGFIDGWRGFLFSFFSSLRFPVSYLKSFNISLMPKKPVIGFDTRPLKTPEKWRGVGVYIQNLLPYLKKSKKIEVIELANNKPNKFDIVHYPYFRPFQKTLSFFKSTPRAVTVHDLIPLKFPQHFPKGIKGSLIWMWQKRCLKKSNLILTDSKASKKDIINILKINPKKVKVTYLSASKDFKPLPQPQVKKLLKKYNLPQKFVLYVGDFNWNKNVVNLTQACISLNLPLVLPGSTAIRSKYNTSHPENQMLFNFQKLAQKHPNLIKTLGQVSQKELVALYNQAFVYCQPSYYEGFGLPVLEAMQSGCPVVCSKSSSLPEVAGKAAIYIKKPFSDKEIKTALKKVLKMTQSKRDQLIKKGLKQAQKFSWKKTAQQTIKYYEEVGLSGSL